MRARICARAHSPIDTAPEYERSLHCSSELALASYTNQKERVVNMIRKSILGLCMLCALAFSALAAQSASAATEGTTVFTCKKPAGGDPVVGTPFNAAHCKDADTDVNGLWRHVEVAENTTTTVTGTTINTEGKSTPSFLESVQSGVIEQLESKLAHIVPEREGLKSWVTNKKDPTTGEHYIEGEVWLVFTEVSVTKPAGKSCKVKGGEVLSKRLKFTSKGQGMTIEFEPKEGTLFAEFEIEGCSLAALNGKYEVKGKVKATPDGTTLATTHAGITEQGTLTVRGQKAGFESTATIEATDPEIIGDTDKPLSVTTVKTP